MSAIKENLHDEITAAQQAANQHFNIEAQYQLFLSKIGLAEKQMPEMQNIQLRQTFYATWGICMDSLAMLSDLEEIEGIEKLDDMYQQIGAFFATQV